MTKHILAALIAGLAGGLLAPTVAAGDGPSVNAELAAVRASTAAFHDVAVSEAAGWDAIDTHCVSRPAGLGGGAMGFHHTNTSLAGDNIVDPLYPEVLVYAPTANGGRRLVAVEWLVRYTESSTPPVLFGQTFRPNNIISAWVLHAWLWQHNPDGIFENFNKRASCDGA